MNPIKAFYTATLAFSVTLGVPGHFVSATALEAEIHRPEKAVGMEFYGLAKIAENAVIAVGEHGTVATLTVKRGQANEMELDMASIGNSGLTAVCTWPNGTLAMTAQDGSIWRRGDARGGAPANTLKVQDIDQERPLFNCWCGENGIGLAVGAFGTILRTVDYGREWLPIAVHDDDDYHLYDVYQSRGNVVIVGEAGRIYRSYDQGENWARDVTPYNGSLFKAVARADGAMLAFGLRGTVLARSTAEADEWRVLRDAGPNEAYFAALQGDHGMLLGGATGDIDRLRNGRLENVVKLPGRPSVMDFAEVNGLYVVATTDGLSVLKLK